MVLVMWCTEDGPMAKCFDPQANGSSHVATPEQMRLVMWYTENGPIARSFDP